MTAGTDPAVWPLVEASNGDRRQPSRAEDAVVHALPGRLRCRLPRVREDAAYARQLKALSEATPGVQSLRVNRQAGSVVVQWDLPLSPVAAATELAALLARAEQPAGDAVPVYATPRSGAGVWSAGALRAPVRRDHGAVDVGLLGIFSIGVPLLAAAALTLVRAHDLVRDGAGHGEQG